MTTPLALLPTSRMAAALIAAAGLTALPHRAVCAGASTGVGTDSERFVAANPEQGFATSFDRRGAEITASGDAWKLGIAVSGVGCGNSIAPVEVAAIHAVADARRIEYERRAGSYRFREWYINGPNGLEQGFTLHESPCAEHETEVAIEIDIRGLTAKQTPGREGLELVDNGGQVRLLYSELKAIDATGRILKSKWALQEDGARLVVDVRGAKYPVVIDPLVWSEVQRIKADDGLKDDLFGATVTVNGDFAAVGGARVSPAMNLECASGAAYVFARVGSTWTQTQKLSGSAASIGSYVFGNSVALSGDTLLIGAPGGCPGADGTSGPGAAFVFVRNGNSWALQQKLVPSDSIAGGHFGSSVALEGNTAVVSTSGTQAQAAYVFERSGTVWSEQQKLPMGYCVFGTGDCSWLVSISGNSILTSARFGAGNTTLVAYSYARSSVGWALMQELHADEVAPVAVFPPAVSISGITAFVCAKDTIFVFVWNGLAWTLQQKIQASDVDTIGSLGTAYFNCAVLGNRAIANFASLGGSAYLFGRNGDRWELAQRLRVSSNADESKRFGEALALSNDTVLAGMVLPINFQTGGNAVSVFNLRNADGDPCTASSECASKYCVDGRCCSTACDGACDVCSVAAGAAVDGQCDVVPPGSSGSPACAPLACNGTSPACAACSSDADCPSDRYCDMVQTCQPRKAQGTPCDPASGKDCRVANCRVCTAGTCHDGFCCERQCSAGEACSAALKISGTSGTCGPVRRLSGAACAGNSDCFSNFCADGRCCNTACGNPCDACSVAAGAKVDGECATVAAGSLGNPVCAPIACNGVNVTCTACTADTDCPSDRYCDKSGACQPRKGQTKACDANAGADCMVADCRVCATGACQEGICCDRTCASGESCLAVLKGAGADGTCGPRKYLDNGMPCSADGSCTSGYCVEGICCESVCGACESCLAARTGKTDGSCAFVTAGTDPNGECTDRAACASPPACNGAGRCECLVTGSSTCLSDGVTKQASTGEETDCSPYQCRAGDCLTSCTTGADCARNARCNSDGQCVRIQADSAGASQDPGCGCRVAGRTAGAGTLFALASLLGLSLLSRRRIRATAVTTPARARRRAEQQARQG